MQAENLAVILSYSYFIASNQNLDDTITHDAWGKTESRSLFHSSALLTEWISSLDVRRPGLKTLFFGTDLLCIIGKVTYPLWALVFPYVKQGNYISLFVGPN